MDKYELVLHDIKDILLTINEVNLVSHGKSVAVADEDTFTSIYIAPTAEAFNAHAYGTDASSYDNMLYIRLIVNMDCTGDDLLWTRTRRKIIDAILDDNPIWSNIVDRDLVSIAHDDYASYPKRTIELLFEFKIREDCIV